MRYSAQALRLQCARLAAYLADMSMARDRSTAIRRWHVQMADSRWLMAHDRDTRLHDARIMR
jgi:hypothetical protein